ncbi:MAG TPA: methylated-DNA--[protein]-cysteine S-methyltransferase [Thermoplasmataceae archaeon]|nr:methylated-DNA--[protein]-cysteine S-methyltransferase [Thermoplasmataceae archaeon]
MTMGEGIYKSRFEASNDRNALNKAQVLIGNVKSKVYCFSLCGSKIPDKSHLIRFTDVEEAEANGFRQCGHCAKHIATLSRSREIVEKVTDSIRENYNTTVGLETLSSLTHISKKQILRAFKDVIGITPKKYLEELRIIRLKEKLIAGKTIDQAVEEIGHHSLSWLYTGSTSKLGMRPATYKKGGKGENLHYSMCETRFGILAVAYTEKGICSVTLSDTRDDAREYFSKEFPKATLVESEDDNSYLEGILAYLDGVQVNLPLDLKGTEFQKKVWSAIKKIPYGTTATYSELASSIGKPKAYRAVANACASNPVPLIVPCHRVIKKSGDLGGYGLGIEKKKELLAFEKSNKTDKEAL